MIYFLQPTDGGPIKIGHSGDVPARVRTLEAHYGTPLALLATMPGGRAEERAIHEQFSHLRFGRTEQFRPDPDLLAFIGRPLFVNQGDTELMEVMPETTSIVTFKCRPEYKAWLHSFAESQRDIPSRMIDLGLIKLAKELGHELPPKR